MRRRWFAFGAPFLPAHSPLLPRFGIRAEDVAKSEKLASCDELATDGYLNEKGRSAAPYSR